MDELLRKAALDYHRLPTPGKISVVPTKALLNQRDLALAYSPGVAAACEEIVRDQSHIPRVGQQTGRSSRGPCEGRVDAQKYPSQNENGDQMRRDVESQIAAGWRP